MLNQLVPLTDGPPKPSEQSVDESFVVSLSSSCNMVEHPKYGQMSITALSLLDPVARIDDFCAERTNGLVSPMWIELGGAEKKYGYILAIRLRPGLSKSWWLPRTYSTPEAAKNAVALIAVDPAVEFLRQHGSKAHATPPETITLESFINTLDVANNRFLGSCRNIADVLLMSTRWIMAAAHSPDVRILAEEVSMPIGATGKIGYGCLLTVSYPALKGASRSWFVDPLFSNPLTARAAVGFLVTCPSQTFRKYIETSEQKLADKRNTAAWLKKTKKRPRPVEEPPKKKKRALGDNNADTLPERYEWVEVPPKSTRKDKRYNYNVNDPVLPMNPTGILKKGKENGGSSSSAQKTKEQSKKRVAFALAVEEEPNTQTTLGKAIPSLVVGNDRWIQLSKEVGDQLAPAIARLCSDRTEKSVSPEWYYQERRSGSNSEFSAILFVKLNATLSRAWVASSIEFSLEAAVKAVVSVAQQPSTMPFENITDILLLYDARSQPKTLLTGSEDSISLDSYIQLTGADYRFTGQNAVDFVVETAQTHGVELIFEQVDVGTEADDDAPKYGYLMIASPPTFSWFIDPIFTTASDAKIALCLHAASFGGFEDVLLANSANDQPIRTTSHAYDVMPGLNFNVTLVQDEPQPEQIEQEDEEQDERQHKRARLDTWVGEE